MNRIMSNTTTRNDNLPIGGINSTGFGCAKVAQCVRELLLDEPELIVVMDDNGEVYALDPSGKRAADVDRKKPHWIVGNYDGKHTDQLVEDLRERAKELAEVAA